ncbi:CLUMA_CG005002, isoform A [Clunio marinus]|uniref:CLUMA_CG005002, isoform A n=1 Tax=Clunio marinus TaxID=568069 RepID=A0A1J1HTD1_9DIPT|nr:CLUMA_CG005002, isoform A [Clunio marinus]
MGHVKQKKSRSRSSSTPSEQVGIELVNAKETFPRSSERPPKSAYPEQLNVGELISQINCRTSSNEIRNDSNNNSNRNNNTTHQTNRQICQSESEIIDDVEKGPSMRHHRQKPLYRRLIAFVRNLWIGAKFNVGSDGKKLLTFYFSN